MMTMCTHDSASDGTAAVAQRRRSHAGRTAGLCAYALSLCLSALPADGQTAAAVAGRVIDATTGAAVSGAVITIEPLPGGLLPAEGAMLESLRGAVTDVGGAYRFAALPAGRYRVHVLRIGYRAATVEIEIRRPLAANLSIGLELDPIELAAVHVEDRAAAPFQRTAGVGGAREIARTESERMRQALFLTPDSRVLTAADVQDGVTLGEGDVFRALQRFAGVSTRDDYTAELWSRGAPWSHTRVLFDGMPLFNPVHALGVLSAVTPEVLGAVFYHPGVRPVSTAEGAAAVVDLRSRPGGGRGELKGVADVSMASAKLALEQSARGGRASWLLAARRSWFDVLSRGLDWLSLGDVDLPYVFDDVVARGDLQLGVQSALEVSVLHEQDRLLGDVAGVLERTRARWGNSAARLTLHTPFAGTASSHTFGFSRYSARVHEFDAIDTRVPPPWVEPESENALLHVRLAGELSAAATAADVSQPARWAAGYDFTWREGRYDGPRPRYHPLKPDTLVRIERDGVLRTAAFWLETRATPAKSVVLQPGLRLETGDVVQAAPSVRVAPAIALRWAISPEQTLSIAAGRSWQYVQAIALAGPSPHPAFHASQFWLWGGDDAPAVRADVATVGAERWFANGWIATVAAYLRQAEGVAVPDPQPGGTARRPLFVVGENRASGIDATLRRTGTAWSTALSYSYGRSEMYAAGLRYPASADRRHVFDALAGVRITPGMRVALAFTGMSGAPFTRAVSRRTDDCELFGFGCGTESGRIYQPNALRTPAYGSLDLSVHWARRLGRWQLGAYAQVRNVLDRDNASTYSGTAQLPTAGSSRLADTMFVDRFERGLPRLPMLGARVTF